MWLINTGMMEKKIHTSLKCIHLAQNLQVWMLSYLSKKKKIGCYNNVDNSRLALWESDEDGLYFDGNI